MTTRRAAERRPLPNSPFSVPPPEEIEQYAVLDRVTHDKYGLGRVVAFEEGAVTVEFGSQRVRITSPFRRLTKL